MRIEVRLLGHVAEAALKCFQVAADIAAVEMDLPGSRLDEAGEHFHSRALAGAVGPEVAEDLARANDEADAVHNGDAAVTLGEKADFQHGGIRHRSEATSSTELDDGRIICACIAAAFYPRSPESRQRPAIAVPKPATSVKITDIRIPQLKLIRDVGSIEPAWNPGSSMSFKIGGGSFVEVHTDQGLIGIGPAMPPDLLPAVKAQLIGKDPFDIETHSARLRYYAGGSAYRGTAGVDIALWDLMGKACGQPLYKLWGGGRDRVPSVRQHDSTLDTGRAGAAREATRG